MTEQEYLLNQIESSISSTKLHSVQKFNVAVAVLAFLDLSQINFSMRTSGTKRCADFHFSIS